MNFGRQRGNYFGNFAVTSVAAYGGGRLHALSPGPYILSYGVVSGALTMPTNIMRAADPLMGALAWSAFGSYTPVLWGLAAIMLVAAAGFAAAVNAFLPGPLN